MLSDRLQVSHIFLVFSSVNNLHLEAFANKCSGLRPLDSLLGQLLEGKFSKLFCHSLKIVDSDLRGEIGVSSMTFC